MEEYRQLSRKTLELMPTIRKQRMVKGESFDGNNNEEISMMSKVASCQYLSDNTQTVKLFKTSSTKELNNEISNIKYEVNRLVKKNPSFIKHQSEEPSFIESLIDLKYQLEQNPQTLKKEITSMRNKFNVKKHQYRKEIQQLKKQLILWQRITEENQDRFADYKDQVQKQLTTIKGELTKYIRLSQISNENSKNTDAFDNQQLLNALQQLQSNNQKLTIQIHQLQQQKHMFEIQKIQLALIHDQKVQSLLINIQNLKQKISILENFQVPASKIRSLETEVEKLQNKNLKLNSQIDEFKIMQSELEIQLLNAIENDINSDSDNDNNNIQQQVVIEKNDDSFYRLSNSVSVVDRLEYHVECRQCEMYRNEVNEIKRLVENIKSQMIEKEKQFELGKSFLQNKIMQSQQFIDLSEKQYENEKSISMEKSKLIEKLKLNEKEMNRINNQLSERVQLLQQQLQLVKLSTTSQKSQHFTPQFLQQQLNIKTQQLLIMKTQSNNCTDLYISKCRELDQKRITFQKTLSQYKYKIQHLTITTQSLSAQLKAQSETHEQMLTFLKQQLQHFQYVASKPIPPTQFNQILKLQIDQINSLQQTMKTKNQQILQLKSQKSSSQILYLNLKGQLQILKLQKITQIKNIQINSQITSQNLKNQLNIFKKSQQSLVNKLKFLTQQCKSKDQFIEKYIKNIKNIEMQGIINDYTILMNMEQFRRNLHHEIIRITELENEKGVLMQTIKKLQDLNKMHDIDDDIY